ncbi:MAG: ATP-binding cassette domain-containing protein [Ilumatobacter sp.]|uniref:ATP-binding cassette domain-containing protein n=1 Tax=Ilumatobacter sp. TaxID=1967498 RepID=UPI00391DB43A
MTEPVPGRITAPASGLVVTDLVKEYAGDGYVVRPLDHLSFHAEPGELVVLLGPSGSGKSTLLSCLGGMLSPTSGSISLNGLDVTGAFKKHLDAYRRKHVGFVFQGFNLIPSLSARENVAVPLIVSKACSRSEALARADALLERVGLGDRTRHRPSQLSGGQQQRVAVARGLVTDPDLLIADEPTANLDHIQAEAVIGLFRELRSQGRVIVVSTHDARLVPVADRVVRMTPDGVEPERGAHEVRFDAGETVFSQEDPADYVYSIVSGQVRIVRELVDGDRDVLAELGPGQYFGELGALLGFPRSATAVAQTDVVATALPPHEFRAQLESPA